MDILIEENPNCPATDHVVFNELESSRKIKGIIAGGPEGDITCDVTGVDSDGRFIPAHARKINDSGEGVAYLIYGGAWGIRIRPAAHAQEPWNLNNTHQWGEPYKVYGSANDILFASSQAES